MEREVAAAWIAAGVVALAMACVVWITIVKAVRRRQRRRTYEAMAARERELRRQAAGRQPRASLRPEQVQAIRASAERAAREVAAGQRADAANPHPPGTQEFVLWVATYHLALTELAEAAAEAQQDLSRP